MKHIIHKIINITVLGIAIFSAYHSRGAEVSSTSLESLSKSVEPNQGRISASSFDATVATFSNLLGQADFSPLSTGSTAIYQSNQIAEAILRSMDVHQIKPSALAVVETFFVKVLACIDTNWTFPRVTANVLPPAGTPDAAAGMDPNAIDDQQLKQQYLNLIATNQANNLKNAQQNDLRRLRKSVLRIIAAMTVRAGEQGMHKVDVLTRFGKNAACKAILEEEFKGSGK